MKKLISSSFVVAALILPATASAQVPEMTEAFVCPVIENSALENSPVSVELGETGAYTIGPSTTANGLTIPEIATNGDGEGVPGDADQSAPGDTDYTAIWAIK